MKGSEIGMDVRLVVELASSLTSFMPIISPLFQIQLLSRSLGSFVYHSHTSGLFSMSDFSMVSYIGARFIVQI